MTAGETIPPLFQEEDQFVSSFPRPFTLRCIVAMDRPSRSMGGTERPSHTCKSGLSRHVVRFVESGGNRFAIKETTLSAAQREFESYSQLMRKEIHTLLPVGIIARTTMRESSRRRSGHSVKIVPPDTW